MSNAGRPELARGGLNPITTDPAPDTDPLWTPNGQQVVFSSQRGGVSGLYRRNADGTGDVEQLMIDEDAGGWFARTWASDGDALVFERRVGAQSDLALLSLGDELTVEPLLDSEFNESRTMLSPNGRWIAYDSNRSGQPEVYVEWFPELGDRELISTQGGRRPRWSPDGHELFYLSLSSDRLAVVSVTAEEDFTLLVLTPSLRDGFYTFKVGRLMTSRRTDDLWLPARHGADGELGGHTDHPLPELVRGTHAPRARPVARFTCAECNTLARQRALLLEAYVRLTQPASRPVPEVAAPGEVSPTSVCTPSGGSPVDRVEP